MLRTTPPFRADHVGSLLRTQSVKRARAERGAGQLSTAELQAIEDEAIQELIERQESVGLKSITDGEARRTAWTTDFLQELDGITSTVGAAAAFQGAAAHRTKVMRVTGRLGFSGHSMLEHFKFLQAHTRATPKFTIPSPTMLASASRDWREIVDRSVYPTLQEMFVDLGLAYRKAIKAFADAGCRYLQLDDCSLAYLCDPKIRRQMTERSDDPDAMFESWIDLINSALYDKPAGMVISTHICRGNFRIIGSARVVMSR